MLLHEIAQMESASRAIALAGLRFLYYNCPQCGHDNMFIELVQLQGESCQEMRCRKRSLEHAVQDLKVVATTIRVVEEGVWQC